MSTSQFNATITLSKGESITTDTGAAQWVDNPTPYASNIPCNYQVGVTGESLSAGYMAPSETATVVVRAADLAGEVVTSDSRASVTIRGVTIPYSVSGDGRDRGGRGRMVEIELRRRPI